MCQNEPTEQTLVSKRKPDNDLKTNSNKKRAKLSIIYSNNLCDSVKTFCCSCDKVVTISGLEDHTQSHHKMTVEEYKPLYGNPKTQIIKLVFHQCGLCSEDMLMDCHVMEKHVKKVHQMEFKQYCNKFMPNVSEHKELIIKCDKCSKTFKKNIQLKAHSKRHNSAKCHGFESSVSKNRNHKLDLHIKLFEAAIHRETQAFRQFLTLTYY